MRLSEPVAYEALPEGEPLRPGERLTFRGRNVTVSHQAHCEPDVPFLLDASDRAGYCPVHGEVTMQPENGKDTLVQEALRKSGHATPRGLKALEVPPERSAIQTKEELFRIAREVLAEKTLTPEEAKACAGHRTMLAPLWKSPIRNRLGYVDGATWRFQVEKALEGALSQQTSCQPNGKWRLLEAEVAETEFVHTVEVLVGGVDDMTGNFNTELRSERKAYFAVAFKLVDTLGNQDIEYYMGKPVTMPPSRGIDSALLQQFMETFATLPKAPAEDPEKAALRSELDALKAEVAKLSAAKGGKRAAAE